MTRVIITSEEIAGNKVGAMGHPDAKPQPSGYNMPNSPPPNYNTVVGGYDESAYLLSSNISSIIFQILRSSHPNMSDSLFCAWKLEY